MEYNLVHKNNLSYLECLPGILCIRNEADAIDWVALCGENETDKLMIYADNLSEDFFHLSTRVAGEILLKFSIYQIKIAAVLTPELVNQGKFQEWVLETNRGNDFRVFYTREKAEAWLVGL